MLNSLLNAIGILLIIYSIYIIKKDLVDKRISDNELIESAEIEHYEVMEDSIDSFDHLIDTKIQISKLEKELNEKELDINEVNEKRKLIIKEKEIISEDNHINPLHNKIIELKSIGLTNEDIAKKLGRGIREIDIILKIYKKQ